METSSFTLVEHTKFSNETVIFTVWVTESLVNQWLDSRETDHCITDFFLKVIYCTYVLL